MRVLIIEDEAKVARALRTAFEREKFVVSLARDGEEGFFLASKEEPDAILLDLGLPRRDGIEILAALRKQGKKTPVLVITARDTVEDRILGLDSGADDYVVKPFAVAEVLARVRALLRRGREPAARLEVGDLVLDRAARRVTRGGTAIALTPTELALLDYLMAHKEEVVTRDMLARDVWQETMRATPLDNVIDVHVARLRKKIDEPFATKLIQTVRGVGFVLREGGA
ncbi:MAG TPA: response regulator transcription factor [Planctomycetota bacterium]|nr:response regulator transcription factor [Planctomycetota bacterium]